MYGAKYNTLFLLSNATQNTCTEDLSGTDRFQIFSPAQKSFWSELKFQFSLPILKVGLSKEKCCHFGRQR
jgi:hypothetical protein